MVNVCNHARKRFSRRALLSLGALCVPSFAGAAEANDARRLYVLPLGDGLPERDIEFVERAVGAFYAARVIVMDRVSLPPSAFYPKRKRYRAERLLGFLRVRMPQDGFRILGVTGVDISTSKPPHADWGILGLAELDDVPCVVSAFRCQRGAKDAQHARIRLGKTCVHELGHTLGLPHCPTRGCLMHDGNGSVLTTDTEFDLCSERCRPRLIRRGHGLSEAAVPWPKP